MYYKCGGFGKTVTGKKLHVQKTILSHDTKPNKMPASSQSTSKLCITRTCTAQTTDYSPSHCTSLCGEDTTSSMWKKITPECAPSSILPCHTCHMLQSIMYTHNVQVIFKYPYILLLHHAMDWALNAPTLKG